MIRTLLVCVLFLVLQAHAASPQREVVSFSMTWDAGFGTNIHVVGNHPDLGNWAPTGSVKLRWTSGNVWTGNIAIQKGQDLEYKFIARSFDSGLYCDGGNVVWEPGSNHTASTSASPAAPYNGKTVFYYSSWTSASLPDLSGSQTTLLYRVISHPAW